MVSVIRANSNNKDFTNLITQLDADLIRRYGIIQNGYHQFNVIQSIDTVIVAYIDGLPAGCGCFKPFDRETVEIKRMYVKPEFRGRGLSKAILKALEEWAVELGYAKAVLETGIGQPEAIGLYQKCGYAKIDNYGQYAGNANSVCFEKIL